MFFKGQTFSQSFLVSEPVYRKFIETFCDNNILHVNDEYARMKGFSAKVMHGNILNGFISYFVGECLPVKEVILQTQSIKYYNPVYMNDKLNFNAEVIDVFDSVRSVELRYSFSCEGKKIAKGVLLIGLL